jgi:plastocyanin
MIVNDNGMVMNYNREDLPWNCESISREHEFVIHAGRGYAENDPGRVFGMSQYEYRVEPCSRVTVTFVNEDDVRHQWMVHDLPKYLYSGGMFHIEAMAGRSMQGTFIVPGDDKTYLVHCDMAQHMEKGMKGQLLVGRGSGDLWNVTGISATFNRDSYLPEYTTELIMLLTLLSFLALSGYLFTRTR